jgi:hypothetical protein
MAKSWKDHTKNAKHYLAIGQKEIYLSKHDGYKDFPWDFAEKCEPGGSHRLEISTDVWFYAKHPCGLEFRWSFDIEPASANVKAHYQIDVTGIREALAKLPEGARASFRKYLRGCAEAVRSKGREWQAIASSQYTAAAELDSAAAEQH